MQKVAARLGEWAQLLKIVNGFLRDRIKANESLSAVLDEFTDQLDDEGPFAFDPRDGVDRARALARNISLSLELLAEPDRAGFGELGIFPEDIEIPVGIVARLWAVTSELKEYKTKALLSRLFDLSLLHDLDLGQGFFRLHDTIRQFLRDLAGKERLVAQHKGLIAILEGAPDAKDERSRRYLYRGLPHHLAEANERQKLDALLLDPGWLKAKLGATDNPFGLFLDYQQYGAGEAQSLIGRTLRLIGGIIARDSRQLPVQLAFITNRSFIESRTFDGFRKVVAQEFAEIYIVDLGGDVRANPKLSGTKHNVFGIQTGVAISFLIKKRRVDDCRIFYARRPEFETAEEKLAFLAGSRLESQIFSRIEPDKSGNWLGLTDNNWESLIPLGAKETKAARTKGKERAIFKLISLGVVTARDEWLYDDQSTSIQKKVKFFINTYNTECARLKSETTRSEQKVAQKNPKDWVTRAIKWTSELENHMLSNDILSFNSKRERVALYRPYVSKICIMIKLLHIAFIKIIQFILSMVYGITDRLHFCQLFLLVNSHVLLSMLCSTIAC
jgi:hypothetical protein